MTTLKVIDGNRAELERKTLYSVALGEQSAKEAGKMLESKAKLKLVTDDQKPDSTRSK